MADAAQAKLEADAEEEGLLLTPHRRTGAPSPIVPPTEEHVRATSSRRRSEATSVSPASLKTTGAQNADITFASATLTNADFLGAVIDAAHADSDVVDDPRG